METRVQLRKHVISIAISITGILLLTWIIAADGWLAELYFHRWYEFISTLLRNIFGRVPFSIGDVIYSVWVVIGIIFLLRTLWVLIRGRWKELLAMALKGVSSLLWLYFIFLLFWGGHYHRTTMVAHLGFKTKDYTTADLYLLTDTLVKLVNRDRAVMDTKPLGKEEMFKMAAKGYNNLAKSAPTLVYRHTSVKSSMFNKYLNYLGVTGYLNPFTNEAQVNTTVPAFQQPFVTCHEIAHQLGFAPEEDANFVGYLAASRMEDGRFRYAANFDMLLYSIRRLGRRNSYLARVLWDKTAPGVREDVRKLIKFYEQYEGPVDDYSAVLYDQYLKANRQKHGIRSYSEVIGWLMAYYRI
ncbi:DUF3810 domain-containing protein [Chitinophaga barathri]|uniref:DUF3810 domain-containing protein n=1 Tax=Chitinophaga barathri TaxID=1647451 RepID=A0A3N4MCH7_9BACT|nr:DUF3810 domain-containing protein [Chitinophaga barathri]RPD41554.1 DUF3810 domain-containing protein [Chitinophaga barathri]